MNSFKNEKTLRQQALSHIGHARYESAFPLYKQLISEYNDRSPDVLSEAGFVSWQLGIIEEAEEYFRRALYTDPTHRTSLINLIDMRLSTGVIAVDTAELLKRILTHYPQDIEAQLLVAKQAFFEGKKNEGKTRALDIALNNAGSQMAQLLVCKLLLNYDCCQETVELTERNLSNGDTHPHFYDYAARAYVSLEQFARAEKLYQLMAEHYPERLTPQCGSAYVKLSQADFLAAKKILEEILNRLPEHGEANRLYYFTLAALKNWEALARATERYVDYELPPLLPLLFHLAALGNLGRRAEAQRLFEKHGERAKQPLPQRP